MRQPPKSRRGGGSVFPSCSRMSGYSGSSSSDGATSPSSRPFCRTQCEPSESPGFITVVSRTEVALVPDLAVFPELRLIDRFEHVVPGAFAALVVVAGSVLGHLAPGLHTSGLQMLEWGFLLPTIVLYHSTFAVNSVARRSGRGRLTPPAASRNNWFVSL